MAAAGFDNPPKAHTGVLRQLRGVGCAMPLSGSPHLIEAGAAVHRPVIPRNEGHGRLNPTLCADDGVHLTGIAPGSLSSAGSSAGGAALWLVHQPLLCEELLLANGKHELLRAIATLQGLVRKAHVFLSPFSTGGIWSQFGRCLIRCGGLAEEPGSRIRLVAIA
jgi:hypothetical protein